MGYINEFIPPNDKDKYIVDKYDLRNPWSKKSKSVIGSWVIEYETENVLTFEVENSEGWAGWNFVYEGVAYSLSGFINVNLNKDEAIHVSITAWDKRVELPENSELRKNLREAFRVRIKNYAVYKKGEVTKIIFDNWFMKEEYDE